MEMNFKADYIFMKPECGRIPSEATEPNHRPVYFRKEICLCDEVEKAELLVAALGIYEFKIDGQKVGDFFFSPGWTDYRKRVYYQSFDVTSLLAGNIHTLSAVVADGWYSGNVGPSGDCQYGTIHCLKAQLSVQYKNGETEVFRTDTSWKTGHGGFVAADLLMGEEYDANLEPDGWEKNGFDDSAWQDADTDSRIMRGHLLLPQTHAGIRKMMSLSPVNTSVDKNDRYIYDMGQNMTGTVTVSANGKKNERLTLRFAELLCEDGTLYTENLRDAKQTDTYVFGEEGEVTYTQHFTFHGFRYVESNLPLTFVEANVLYSAAEQTGLVKTDNPLVNRIFENQLWGHRCNWLDIPMDCPQRDERLGWLGDTQAFIQTACYNMNMRDLYRKYMTDVRDAQLPNGEVPNIAPTVDINLDRLFMPRNFMLTFSNYAGYGDGIFLIPYRIYTQYGRTDVIEENYEAMQRYISFLMTNGTQPCHLADYLAVEPTPAGVVADAYYAYDFALLAEMAEAIGKTEDAAMYREKATAAKADFCKKYVKADGKIESDTQCVYAMALQMDLVPNRKMAEKHLVDAVTRANNHITTGYFGTPLLLPALCEMGRSDLAYTLLLNKTYPSWGYMIEKGATTIWEHWDSITEDGMLNPGMNSLNHYGLGSVGAWMYEYMGGIKPLAPGFEKIQIKPFLDERVNESEVSYDSPRGKIKVWFNVEKGKMELCIPAGKDTLVCLPCGTQIELPGGEYSFERQTDGSWNKCN